MCVCVCKGVCVTIRDILSRDQEYEACADALQNKTDVAPIHSAIKAIGNPTAQLALLHKQIALLLNEINGHMNKIAPSSAPYDSAERENGAEEEEAEEEARTPPTPLSDDVADRIEIENGETLRLMYARWEKLFNDLWDAKEERFDMSKIPDVYDCCKYDAIHSQDFLGLKSLEALYTTARKLAELVCPSEYGLTRNQRLVIGSTICKNLVEKIARDMRGSVRSQLPKATAEQTDDDEHDTDQNQIKINPEFLDELDEKEDDFIADSIKTRLYFTSESHLHSVVNALRYINVEGEGVKSKKYASPIFDSEEHAMLDSIREFDYLTQIVFKVFEDTTKSELSAERLYVRIGVSPGVAGDALLLGRKHLECKPLIWFPRPESGRMITYHNFVKACKNISEQVNKSREDLLVREQSKSAREGEETAEQRAERLAHELIRAEEEQLVKERDKVKGKEDKRDDKVKGKEDKEDKKDKLKGKDKDERKDRAKD